MCATFTFRPGEIAELTAAIKDLVLDESSPLDRVKDDVYPYGYACVITSPPQTENLLLSAKRYSLTPSWSKEEKVKWATYNARMARTNARTGKAEVIYEVPTWKGAFGNKHCIVPLHSFRESCRDGKAKGHIAEFTPQQSAVIYAAGIYDDWINKKTGEVLSSFAIVTSEPNQFLIDVGHDRSPAILSLDNAKRWLEPFASAKAAYAFLEENKEIPPMNYELVRKLKSGPVSDDAESGVDDRSQ